MLGATSNVSLSRPPKLGHPSAIAYWEIIPFEIPKALRGAVYCHVLAPRL